MEKLPGKSNVRLARENGFGLRLRAGAGGETQIKIAENQEA